MYKLKLFFEKMSEPKIDETEIHAAALELFEEAGKVIHCHLYEPGVKLRKSNFYRLEIVIPDHIAENEKACCALLSHMRQMIRDQRLTGPDRRPLTLVTKANIKIHRDRPKHRFGVELPFGHTELSRFLSIVFSRRSCVTLAPISISFRFFRE